MNDKALMVPDNTKLEISFSPEAHEMQRTAVATCALVQVVRDASTQELAVDAQRQCREIIGATRKEGKAIRAPHTDFNKRVIAAEDGFVAQLEREEMRVARLVGDFQQLEIAKQKAAEAAARLEAENLERARQAELKRLADEEAARLTVLRQQQQAADRAVREAKNAEEATRAQAAQQESERQRQLAAAKSIEDMDAVQADFNERAQVAAESAPVFVPTRAEGQVIGTEWDITVVNIHDLYRAHPNAVKMEPRLTEIKALLDMDIQVRGVTAKKVTKAGVRLGTSKAIEV